MFKFRLWHLLVLFALLACLVPKMTVLGNCRAEIVIEEMLISHDEQWDKYWAILACRFISPKFLRDERLDCFIEVEADFRFGDKYSVGDRLDFRYQFKESLNWDKEDPRQKVVKKMFGINVEPVDGNPGFLVHVEMPIVGVKTEAK